MNVPLKKRHIYGKLNGSASSLNEPSTKRLHSSQSNYEDSEYEHQSSYMDGNSSLNGPATLKRPDNSKMPQQYLSIGEKAVPADIQANIDQSSNVSSSSSVIMSSSASNHDSSERNEDDSTSSSSGSNSSSSRSSDPEDTSDGQSICDPLTEKALNLHNEEFEPMTSKDRIQFWNIAEEFNEIEDDFDDKKYFSKPIRSERLQKAMYKKSTPIASTSSRKSKKEDKPKKTDEKSTSSTKQKSKDDTMDLDKPTPTKPPPPPPKTTEETDAEVMNPSPVQTMVQPDIISAQPIKKPIATTLVNNSIVVVRQTDETPSAIKFRVNYSKGTANRSDSFKIPTTPNTSRTSDVGGGCANCSKHTTNGDRLNDTMSTTSSSCEIPPMANNNQEEFYKYLGIGTNQPHEKTSPEPIISPTDSNRRSLRVFFLQKQNQFSRSNEKLSKDDRSPEKPLPKSPTPTNKNPNNELAAQNDSQQSIECNGNVSRTCDETPNGVLESQNTNSSHIKQRRSYETQSPPDASRPLDMNIVPPHPNRESSSNAPNETDMDCDVLAYPQQNSMETTMSTSNRFGESSRSADEKPRIVRIPKRKILLPNPILLTAIFKRYRNCFRQNVQPNSKSLAKRVKKRPSNNSQVQTADTNKSININGEKHADLQPQGEELISTFSPNSITPSNASIDSAIVVNANLNELSQSTVTLTAAGSTQWQQEQVNQIEKSQFPNPLDAKHGAVLAILTHSVSPSTDDVIVVIQESQISYWYSTSKVLSMFGIARSWKKIVEVPRVTEDIEIESLHQHRLIDLGEQFPVYVELRAKESPPDGFRQCHLTFAYLNVYYVKPDSDGQPQIVMERVNLDTLKGFAKSIYYTALRTSPSILMTWTEKNVNNQTRCGIVKYTLRTPALDNIEEILDYSYFQHDINTLYAMNDYHVVGCGDRTVSMWDHRNGNLLIDTVRSTPENTAKLE